MRVIASISTSASGRIVISGASTAMGSVSGTPPKYHSGPAAGIGGPRHFGACGGARGVVNVVRTGGGFSGVPPQVPDRGPYTDGSRPISFFLSGSTMVRLEVRDHVAWLTLD